MDTNKCCACGYVPAKKYAIRPDHITGKGNMTLYFCYDCHERETYPCSQCKSDIDLDWIKKQKTYYHSPCPYCGEPIEDPDKE